MSTVPGVTDDAAELRRRLEAVEGRIPKMEGPPPPGPLDAELAQALARGGWDEVADVKRRRVREAQAAEAEREQAEGRARCMAERARQSANAPVIAALEAEVAELQAARRPHEQTYEAAVGPIDTAIAERWARIRELR